MYVLLILCCFSASVWADDTDTQVEDQIKVLTFPIPLLVESEEQGLFIDLAHAISKEAKLPIDIDIKNTPRALRAFRSGDYDILMPALDVMFSEEKHVIKSRELFYRKRDYVFTLSSKPLIKNIAQLKGLRVGLTRAYPYSQTLLNEPGIDFVYVDTDEQNAQLLSVGRIDAFVVEESSGIQAFRNTNLIGEVHYPKANWISEQDVYFAVYKDGDGKHLEKRISQALTRLKQSGLFEQIMSGSNTGL
ncbi:substrate-binding periplasmic protein [Aestuariibacter salexigens]|uniref:substrate-binding periplasmic protein n=1 Tax=Aestuariibacter salexigens TaxID=226010 RepID=UPI0004093DE1|nr:transporter substrate-binding domain-containing protein [Aestuariibacter salexigens]